jgi:hypothetical protein
MSVTFDLVINPVLLLIAVLAGVLLGFALGRGKLAKIRAEIYKLEGELMNSHQETLESQRAFVALQSKLKDQAIPVIPMKISGNKENPKEKATK